MNELEAVNIMLTNIGQVPVSSISVDIRSDSNIALRVLTEYSNELQSEGFDFNTVEEEEIIVDSSGMVPLSSLNYRVWNSYPYPRYRISNGFLYNIDDKTNQFTVGTKLKINRVYQEEFENLPHTLQRYVLIRAARVFANRVVGAGEINAYTQEDEARAKLAWLNDYTESMSLNVFSNHRHIRPQTSKPFHTIQRSTYGNF